MKTNYWLLFIFVIIINAACNKETDKEQDSSLPYDRFYICDVSKISPSFGKIILKDEARYMVTEYNENSLPIKELFIYQNDTIGIYFNEKGLPEVITDGREYIILGQFIGNQLKCGILDKSGNTEIIEIETNINWDNYTQSLEQNMTRALMAPNSLADNQKEKIVNTATKSLIEIILNGVTLNGFSLGKGGSWGFLTEVLAYSITDDQSWLDAVDDASTTVGIVITILTPTPTNLVLSYYEIWWKRLILPWVNGGYNLDKDDPRSPYAAKIEYLYKTINGASFIPNQGEFDWQGGTWEIELSLSEASFEVKDLVWSITSDQPDWVTAIRMPYKETHKMRISISPNITQEPRKHTIVAKLLNIYGETSDLTFSVHQGTKLRTDPASIEFTSIEEVANVTVYSDEEWEITTWPEWCNVKRKGLYGFTVTQNSTGEGKYGVIVIEVKRKNQETYEVEVPVSQSVAWNGTSWNFSGTVKAENTTEPVDFGINIIDVANNKFTTSGELTGQEKYLKIECDEYNRLIMNFSQTLSEAGISVETSIKFTFERIEVAKAIGKMTGSAFTHDPKLGSVSIAISGDFTGTLMTNNKLPSLLQENKRNVFSDLFKIPKRKEQ